MNSCNFAGNSDVYGLGVRLGLYLQWFSTVTAVLLAPEELNGFMDVNTSFTFAILLVLIYLTVTRGDTLQSDSLYAVEAFILVMLCLAGGICGVIAAPWPREPLSLREAIRIWLTFRVLLLGAALTALNTYGIWFWSVGMYHMARLSCGDKIFMFARANLFGRFRIFALVYQSGSIIATVISIGVCVIALLYDLITKLEVSPTSPHRGCIPASFIRRLRKLILPFYFIVIITPFVAIIEGTIKYNHIQGVQSLNTTGQLIPLFIGVVGFLQLLSKTGIFRSFRRRAGPKSEPEEPKDEEAKASTYRAEEDTERIQPDSGDALEWRNTI